MKNYSKFASFLVIVGIVLNVSVPFTVLATAPIDNGAEKIDFCHVPSNDLDKAEKFLDRPESAFNGHENHDEDFIITNEADEYLCDAIIAQTACANFLDDDNDGLIDALDPGCWTDQNDPNTYNPADTDETHVVVPPPTTGSLLVNKVAVNGDATFSFSGNGITNFNITTVSGFGSQLLENLVAGFYSITEGVLGDNWSKTADTCQNIEVVAGQTTECTITNTYTAPVDACPLVDGFQESGPCANEICEATEGNTWNQETQSCDGPTPVDVCLNVEGMQTSGPCADQVCTDAGNIWNIETQTCDPAPVDACPLDEGFQEAGPCQSDDVCPNDPGIQTNQNECTPTIITCDEGYHLEGETCVPNETTPTDVCANLEGNQSVVPEGYTQDGANCTQNQSNNPAPETPNNGGGGNGGGSGGSSLSGGRRRDVSGLFGGNSGEVLGASTEDDGLMCEPYLKEYIKLGAQNNPEEVKKLQIFLNQFFEVQNPVTGIYGQITFDMVKKFQTHQETAVLTPWTIAGLPTDGPTGYVYKTTKRWINILKCPEMIATTPVPPLP